jgi:phosphatidylinositol glycan class C protein
MQPASTSRWRPVAPSSALNPDHLAPQDAYYHASPARKRPRKGAYKKLLWFKQPFPDNYTDEETFLDHLQRNPRLQPYEFWSLMADSTVIVQQVASVALFACSFAAIFQERVSPLTVVSWASVCSFLAWVLWDYWMGQEQYNNNLSKEEGSDPSKIEGSADTPAHPPPYRDPDSSLSPKNQQRLATAKSAALIYAALLGLSPILKSLTRSTTSDSIWAISTWLLCMNVAFFDYGTSNGSQYVLIHT